MFFLYADGLIPNPTYPVQIGIDGGDGVNYYTVPNSLTPDIVNITRTSNVNQPGLWVFKVDNYNIIAGVSLKVSLIYLQVRAPRAPPTSESSYLQVRVPI